MDVSSFRSMDRMGLNYWWYRGKQSFIQEMTRHESISRNGLVLDLGCGTGTLFRFLEGWGKVLGLELSADAIVLARQKSEVPIIRGSMEDIPLRQGSFQLIAVFDCLEHLNDDGKAVREIRSLISDDGYLLVSVPAFKHLTTWRDKQLRHMRRYTRPQLQQLLESSGFEIRSMIYGYFCLYPALLIKAFKDRLTSPPASFPSDIRHLEEPWNSLLSSWLRLEAWLAVRVGLPVGTSILALARPAREVR